MKTKRILALLIATVLALVTFVTGCGEGGKKDSNKTNNNVVAQNVNKEIKTEFGEVEVAAEKGYYAYFFSTVEKDGCLFSNTTHRFTENIPEELAGVSQLRAPSFLGVDATVTKAGWIYVLTTVDGKEDSQQKVLEGQGFEIIRTFRTSNSMCAFNGETMNSTVLMGKNAAVGDKISYESWGCLFAGGTVKPADNPSAPIDEAKTRKVQVVRVNLDLNGHFAFYTSLPDKLDFVDSAWDRQYYATEGGVYINGELREDIYIAKVHNNTYIIYWGFFNMVAEEGMTLKIDGVYSNGVDYAIRITSKTYTYDGLGTWVQGAE